MKTIKYISAVIFPFVLIAMALSSCTERINIATGEAAPRLVIYGYITTDAKQHYVRINRSTGYFATTKPEGLSDAMVTISSGDTTYTLHESSVEAGLYLTDVDVQGVEGKTYKLNVSVAFDATTGVQEYEASSYLPLVPTIDSIKLRDSKVLTDHVEVLLWGKVPDNEINYMSFHVSRNGEILNDSLINFSVVSDEYIDTQKMVGIPCFYIDQDEDRYQISPNDLVTLRMDIFTEEYGKFIENAQSEVSGSIPIFSGPPANIKTNIKAKSSGNKIPLSGFFSAYGGNEASTYYKQDGE